MWAAGRAGLRATAEAPLVRTCGVLAVAGVAFGAFVLVMSAPGRHVDSTSTLFSGTVGGLYLGAGMVACLRRPENRVGLLMVAVGIGWFAEDLQISIDPVVHTAGLLVRSAASGFLLHLLLAFPDGRLRSTVDRVLAGIGYVAVFVLMPLSTLTFTSTTPNLLLVHPLAWTSLLIGAVQMAVSAAVLAVLFGRWFTASPPARRVLAPLYGTGLVGGLVSVLDPVLGDKERWVHGLLSQLGHAAVILLPLAFLAGMWRVRLGRTPVAELLMRLPHASPAELEDLLAKTLGDPSLRVGYFHAGHGDYIDRDGKPLPIAAGQAVTPVERDGRPVAALMHDRAVSEDRYVLEAVVSAAALELDNQRLAAEVRAQLVEVRASRARIVAAGDEQRRRVERDLHDGAQQQLVTVALTLRLARQKLADQEPAVAELLERSMSGLEAALGELRELARGIHPAILSEAGLLEALRALAARTPHPVELTGGPLPELPSPISATAYFVAAEAVTNALKHADASTIRIDVGHVGGVLRLTVTDDGSGGADLAAGTGLLGLRDRVFALDGELTVHSPAGAGTTVLATMPLERP